MSKFTLIFTILLFTMFIISTTAIPVKKPSGKILNKLSILRRPNASEKRKGCKCNAHHAKNRRLRKKQYLAKLISSCVPPIRKACKSIRNRCSVRSIFKRSIDDVTQKIVKRSASNSNPKQIQVNISCQFCQANCSK